MNPNTPMFPGYCFCGFQPAQSMSPVRSTPGVFSLVRFGHEIAVIQPEVIERLRKVEAILQANAADGGLKPGDSVKVVQGPFAGFEGLASRVSAKRIDVLMGKFKSCCKALEDMIQGIRSRNCTFFNYIPRYKPSLADPDYIDLCSLVKVLILL